MKVIQGTKVLLLTAVTAFAGYGTMAQSGAPVPIPVNMPSTPAKPVIPPMMDVSQTGYRSGAITSAFKKIKRDHFNFQGVNDAYSQQVWQKFIHILDPNNDIFLQEDIQQLTAYKNQIDDDVNAGSSAFFDAVYAIYSKRVREAESICMRILQQPFNMQQKESVEVVWNKNWTFPANEQAREDLWRRYLKYYTLRHYMEADTVAAQKVKTFNPVIEAKARENVRKWHAEYFRQSTSKDAMKEKFAQYMSVMIGEIDPHSSFTAPDDRSYREMLTKRYYGLGIELGTKDADFFVKRMMSGGTAYKSGVVKENDIIVAIMNNQGEMVPINGMDATHVTTMIRGDKGSSVTLKLQQPGEEARTVTLQRDEVIDTESRAKSALIEKNGKKFGYIYLPSFYIDPSGTGLKGASGDVLAEIEKLKENEIDGIIMDLRGNPGGALHEVVRMCAGFVPANPISWLRSKDSVQQYTSPDMDPLYNGPLTVMVDESSASASEIFAAAMQDLGRAIIIGTSSTFGKGTAQSGFNLGKLGDAAKNIPDTAFGTINLTLQKFYRISGTATQLNGVVPDIVLQKRMSLESIMEKDYSSALPNDTITLLPYNKVKSNYDFKKVIQLANARIKTTPALMDIDNNMAQLKTLRNKTILLNLEDFRKEYRTLYDCEKRIEKDRTLPAGHLLNMQPSLSRSMSPAMLKTTPGEELRSKAWLEKLSKDIYLDQTVSVLEDMLANQL